MSDLSVIKQDEQSTPSRFLRWGVGFFAVLHFFVMLVTSTQTSVEDLLGKSGLVMMIDHLGFVTGSANHFGFFAPGVLSQFRAQFIAESAGGEEIARGNLNQGNFETSFRFHNMIENFWVNNEESDLRRALSASWAAKIMGQYPRSDRVRIQVDAYVIPSMRQYREGDRPKWIPHYKAEFARGSSS